MPNDLPQPANRPDETYSPTVARLFVYPVKSARGFSPPAWTVDDLGFACDRRWLVTLPDGSALTQREEPRLALLVPAVSADHLTLTAPGLPSLEVPLEPPALAEVLAVTVLGAPLDTVLLPAADAWLTRFLGYPARLVRLHESREVDPCYALGSGDRTGFTDGFPFLLVGESSLADLNTRLAVPVPMDRFRPNLVIAGAPPFAEDSWRRLRLGEVELALVKPCARCVITTTDQLTAERGEEPLRTLAGFRRAPNGKVMFGQNAIHRGAGTIRVDDVVVLLDPAAESPGR